MTEEDKRRILKAMVDDLNALQEDPDAETTNFNRELMKYGTREKIESILEESKIFLRAFEKEVDKLEKRKVSTPVTQVQNEEFKNSAKEPVQKAIDPKEDFSRYIVRKKKR